MMRQKTYVLARAILERKEILFGSSENVFKPQILKEKEDAWEAVRMEMIEQGFTQFERKSWRDVRNHDWQYLRRSAVAKYEHNQKPGIEAIPYNDVDKVVFEIMGNESESPSSAQNDFVNGAIAASYNWLKVEDQQQQMQASDGSVTSFNSDQQQQQQINSILNSALVASASMLSRKMSWEINSPDESPREKNNQKQQQSHHYPQNNEIEVIAEKNKDKDTDGQIPNADLLQSIIASSLPSAPATIRPKLERTETRPSVSSGVITSTSAAPPPLRKRRHSSSSAPAHSIEDEIQEAKLQHILLQVKREEILLKQEKARLLQEEAKLRQEQIKLELLERQLKTNSSNYKSTADTQRDI